MGLSLSLNGLNSRATRNSIGEIRRFSVTDIAEKKDDSWWSGLSRFFGGVMAEVGKMFSGLLRWTFTSLWGLITSTVQFIWNFNWNITDESIDAQTKAMFDSLGGQLGGALGNALGWGVCGALPGLIMMKFNKPLAIHILKNVGEEALDEIAGNVANLIRTLTNSGIRIAFLQIYKNVRTLWREPDAKMKERLKAGGATDEQIAQKMAERNKPWSFAIAFENWIESWPEGFVRNFIEEFFEELFEACTEAGYVVAGGMDSFYAQQKRAQQNQLGDFYTVEILPERE